MSASHSFAIGIPTINRGEDLLSQAMDYYKIAFPNTEFFIIDNSGKQNLVLPSNLVTTIYSLKSKDNTGLGVAASWNKLCNLIFTKYNYALILNDDVILRAAEGDIQKLITSNNPIIDFATFNSSYQAFLIRDKTFHTVGPFDASGFPRAYFEDLDYTNRLRMMNIETTNTKILDVTILENGSASIKKNNKLNSQFNEHKNHYHKKWGHPSRPDIFTTPFNEVGRAKKYEELCYAASDINEHLPTLRKYAEKCKHITEMGVRTVVSTYAFIESKPDKIRSYDIEYHVNMKPAQEIATALGIDCKFIIQDVLWARKYWCESTIEPTDMLFIDTLHNNNQLVQELALHAEKARKYIAFHDVVTFGYNEEQPKGNDHLAPKGLLPAIFDFLIQHQGKWAVDYFSHRNNGLLILKRLE